MENIKHSNYAVMRWEPMSLKYRGKYFPIVTHAFISNGGHIMVDLTHMVARKHLAVAVQYIALNIVSKFGSFDSCQVEHHISNLEHTVHTLLFRYYCTRS